MELSMEIILHAGDAKRLIYEALDKAAQTDFTAANILLNSAHEKIKEAHACQTKTIQKEANGAEFKYSVLFSHAQDTMMTIFSEYNMTLKMITILKDNDQKIKKLEALINESSKGISE
ncbi:PTS system cellobiose-specific IIA component [Breznakia sp. PF5-3]|uniref:PTS lactose/cellobiose transporter subunit IIA n=1 Tax=unclassified Breznakia TaxID=2623764 RepID=UPI0024051E73|nr:MULTISPECIES: PTS lactose/cellobiose transporter subunit IIA [unclassified Breznakia]MDF9824535.1 PTS system cellobiose-specific IIA component [Breznakia sp. PM6-1]MDF9835321.1 PTS system cellobiose-specific IIA component [Breznakia sp. PF5-3]MDF9837037.1 PTS system cellobiose-specific IIA component [Breznakia sp. PFB2-8]MDF9858962.1 PTS system cellobiose-specific IIA component [Breznakia sp. PH5-24]